MLTEIKKRVLAFTLMEAACNTSEIFQSIKKSEIFSIFFFFPLEDNQIDVNQFLGLYL